MNADVTELNPMNPIANLLREGKGIVSPPPFKPSNAPLDEITRLSQLGHDLTSPQSQLEKLVFDPQTKTSTEPENKLRFEARACGTPVSTPQDFGLEEEHTPSSIDPLFGAELLKTLSGRPLSGAARVEAMRRLTVAMTNPTRQNLESVLLILVTDDPNHSQFKS